MKKLVAFDLDGTLAESKQPITEDMAQALSELTSIMDVAVISGGDWPQFETQLVGRLNPWTDFLSIWLMPTSGTKLYTFQDDDWTMVYADLFSKNERKEIVEALSAAVSSAGFAPDKIWGDQIEDRGSQITFSALGQEAPLEAKEGWDSDFKKRNLIRNKLQALIPELSINLGGTTSIDVTRKGIDKAYGLRKLREHSGIAHDDMLFIGDAIFPGGNDYPAKQMGLDTICVRDSLETLSVIQAILACQR